ncbi:MAG: uroporphyrinogen decarboxylase [Acidimicrobiia bacterium]
MTKPLLAALEMQELSRPPVWIMRQAGRYLPEYRQLRERHSFQEAVSTPKIAAELTLQPVRRFGVDGAVIFADIMTPLQAMGVEIDFDPGPKLKPLSPEEVVGLPDLDPDRVAHVSQTIEMVRDQLPAETAVIGFAGAPVTLLAYLLEGGGSKDFMAMRAALRARPSLVEEALAKLASSMNAYLAVQVASGAEVVQLFDTWAGLLDRSGYERWALPAARQSLAGIAAPTIYFAPGAGHTLELQRKIGATGYGVDWRVPIGEALATFDGLPVQGNLDPAVLLSDPATIAREVKALLEEVGGWPGHIMNLGHGIDRRTPPENVAALVGAVRS